VSRWDQRFAQPAYRPFFQTLTHRHGRQIQFQEVARESPGFG